MKHNIVFALPKEFILPIPRRSLREELCSSYNTASPEGMHPLRHSALAFPELCHRALRHDSKLLLITPNPKGPAIIAGLSGWILFTFDTYPKRLLWHAGLSGTNVVL
jgi:hypothetical protein